MAKVSLRVYNHEIEGMIESGQLDEAIAHCQHILKTFSMHIATYRLLGKAFLEGRRYGDAADIFQRILMSVPDDFVAHVGMSIIRDDENKLDDAIWHMERAFEVQPSNPAIQGELRRLYGRRDGVEPPKIRLSRDALANMYSQGELFNQAIAEIRTVLADDPNRPDLQVMLARAYFRSGQKVEAAELAGNLLKKYPYCMDALRILVEVLPGSSRAENTQVYRQRLRLIDPYTSFVTGSVFQADQVADSAIAIDRLEYVPGTAPALPQPNWADSLGIKMEEPSRQQAEPDWLAAGKSTEQPPSPFEPVPSEPAPAEPAPVEPAPARLEPAPEKGEGSIPDWMQTAGWKSSTGAVSEEPVEAAGIPPAEPNAPTEIPEWLKSLAPPGAIQDAGTAGVESAPPPAPGEGSGIPEWFSTAGQDLEAAQAGAAGPTQAMPAPSPSEEPSVPTTPLSQKARPLDAAPDMLSREEQDAGLAWLEGITAGQGAKEGEPSSKPEERPEEMPDWLRQATGGPPAPQAAAEPATSPRKTVHIEPPAPLPEEPASFTPESVPPQPESPVSQPPVELPSKPVGIEDDTMAWLESLAAKQGAKPEELLTKPEERPETPPEWIQKAAENRPGEPAPAAAPSDQTPMEAPLPPSVASPSPTPPPQVASSTPTPPPSPNNLPMGDDITITTWLKKKNVEEAWEDATAPPPEGPPTPSGSQDLPDWLRDLDKPARPPEPPKVDDGLPDWLRRPTQPSAPESPAEGTVQPPASGSEPSTWIDENPLAVQPPAPTSAEEWIPADTVAPPAAQIPETGPAAQPSRPVVEVPPASVARVPPPVTGNLSKVPVEDKDAELLSAAQAALDGSQLNVAMQDYGKLIKKGRLLEEVIHDLKEAIYRFPVDIIIWQTLGDAHMRANHLQEALDAYTKAEELLR